MISEKSVERLCLYRRLLHQLCAEGYSDISSTGLALRSNGTAAQVRRDLMEMGYGQGTPRGHSVRSLLEALDAFLDVPDSPGVVLVGVGNLGRAVLAFSGALRSSLRIFAAVDTDPQKIGRVINGCRCYGKDEMARVILDAGVRTAILAVPDTEAQEVTDTLVSLGIVAILSYAPVVLNTPESIYVEYIDMPLSLEKVACLAHLRQTQQEETL